MPILPSIIHKYRSANKRIYTTQFTAIRKFQASSIIIFSCVSQYPVRLSGCECTQKVYIHIQFGVCNMNPFCSKRKKGGGFGFLSGWCMAHCMQFAVCDLHRATIQRNIACACLHAILSIDWLPCRPKYRRILFLSFSTFSVY